MKRNNNDKILDNSYNLGTIEFEHFGNFALDDSYKSNQSDYDKFRDEKLYELLNDIITNSKWNKYKDKKFKISKYDYSEYFEFMRTRFNDTTYSEIEIFIKIIELVSTDYKQFYDMIPNNYKIILLKELDKSYDLKNKLKTTKLF